VSRASCPRFEGARALDTKEQGQDALATGLRDGRNGPELALFGAAGPAELGLFRTIDPAPHPAPPGELALFRIVVSSWSLPST